MSLLLVKSRYVELLAAAVLCRGGRSDAKSTTWHLQFTGVRNPSNSIPSSSSLSYVTLDIRHILPSLICFLTYTVVSAVQEARNEFVSQGSATRIYRYDRDVTTTHVTLNGTQSQPSPEC